MPEFSHNSAEMVEVGDSDSYFDTPKHLKPVKMSNFVEKIISLAKDDAVIEVRRDEFMTKARGTIEVHDGQISVQRKGEDKLDLPISLSLLNHAKLSPEHTELFLAAQRSAAAFCATNKCYRRNSI